MNHKLGFLKMYVINNKKVLLLERKRHTARHVANTTHYAVPVEGTPFSILGPDLDGGGGVPHPADGGGYPWPGMGYPTFWPKMGVPSISRMGYSPCWDWMGYPPPIWKDGVTPNFEGWGIPCWVWMGIPLVNSGWGKCTPPPRSGQTDIPKYNHYLPSYYVRGR